jgi:hypothetical protein
LQPGITDINLYAGTLVALKQMGVRHATVKIQAGNTPLMSIYSTLGFRFLRPGGAFHWHAPETSIPS